MTAGGEPMEECERLSSLDHRDHTPLRPSFGDRHQIVFGVKVVEHLITLLQLDRLFMRYLSDRLMQFVSSFLLNIHAMNTFVNCAH